MDGLADYASDEDGEKLSKFSPVQQNQKNGVNRSPEPSQNLEAEWESFQQMIAPGSPQCDTQEKSPSPQKSKTLPEKSPDKKKSRSRSASSESSSGSEDSESGSEDSETGSESDSSPERKTKDKKKKRRNSSSCQEDAETEKSKRERRSSSNSEVKPEDISQTQDSVNHTQSSESSSLQKDTTQTTPEKSVRKDPQESHKEASKELHKEASKESHKEDHRSEKQERLRHRRSRSRSRRSRKDRRRRSRDRCSRSGGRRSRSRDRHRRREGHRRRRRGSPGEDRERRRERRRHGHRRRRRSHSKSRERERRPSRARSPSPRKRRNEPLSFKEKLKQSFLEVQKQAAQGKLNIEDLDPDKAGLLSMKEKPSLLPLNTDKPLAAMAGGGSVTPQQALLHTMAAMHQKAQEITGVVVPKYYNPAAVNPLKYAEQVQKRKLLWSKKEPKDQETQPTASSSNQWKAVAYTNDGDEKAAAKFRKLMGIRDQGSQDPAEGASKESGDPHASELVKKQEELFRNLDKEYEFARMTTHTHRGVGLGFTSHVPYFPK